MTILQNVIASVLPAKKSVTTLPDFWTVFGSGVTIGSPTFGPAKHVHLPITGTDAVTGYSDTALDTLYGASTVYEFWGIGDMADATDMDADPEHLTFFTNSFAAVNNPLVKGGRQATIGCNVRETGSPNPQTHLYIGVQSAAALANPLESQYFEIDFILSAGLDLQAGDTGTGKWASAPFELKTGAWYDTGAGTYKQAIGDLRMGLGITGTDTGGVNRWYFTVDNQANGVGVIPELSVPPYNATYKYVDVVNLTEPVRLGVRTKAKIWYKRPSGVADLSTGRLRVVIKAEGYDAFELCNITGGQLCGQLNLPVTRILMGHYTSAELPNHTILESLQIYDQPSDDLLKALFRPIIRFGGVDISLAGGLTQPREGTDTLSIDFTRGTPSQVTIVRNDNASFAGWPDGNLSQYFTTRSGGVDFAISLAHMNLGANTIQVISSYSDYQKATDSLSLTIEEVVEEDPEEISVAMAGGLTQYQEGIDTLQITFVNGTPVAVNIARNDNVTFAQWPTGNLYQYFREVSGGVEFDLDLSYLNLGENSIGVTATYSDASTAEAFLTLHISEVPVEEPPPDPTPPSPLPAFPGAEGFGAASVGGRGGAVLFVTNLNDSGAGSLREALLTTGPRTVIFRVGGTIDLLSDISLSGASLSYLTVAGQTAPGGIQTRYKTIEMSNGIHDVIFRFVRHRRGWEDYTPGETESNNHGPGLTIYSYGDPCYNIIIDHCSFAWQQDDNSFWQSVHDCTWQWCIMAEAKNTIVDGDPVPLKGVNGKGWIGGTEDGDGALMYNVSLHHNFMAHNYQRSPLVKGAGPFEIVNNLVYNWSAFGTSIDYTNAEGSKVNLIGNYYKEGPDAFDRYAVTINDATHPADMIYVSDNISPQRTSGAQDEWDVVGVCDGSPYCNTPASTSYQKDTAWAASDYPITIADAIDVPALVLAGVGATLPARDATDTRIVSEYYLGTGSIHTYNDWPTITGTTAPTDADNDGMADSWETSEAVTDPSGVAANGYTNLENYINSSV